MKTIEEIRHKTETGAKLLAESLLLWMADRKAVLTVESDENNRCIRIRMGCEWSNPKEFKTFDFAVSDRSLVFGPAALDNALYQIMETFEREEQNND